MAALIPPVSRRDEYAEATRQAIVAAARELFSKQGFFSTKVDEIAARARVSPATVYAVSGGKYGLLRTLIESWTGDSIIGATIARIKTMDDPVAIVRLVASLRRRMQEEFGDVVRVLLNTAPHDKTAAESLKAVTARYRRSFVPISRRLAEVGALREELDVSQAVDVWWFYFGYSGMSILHDDNGWTYARAEEWLCQEASRALLRAPCKRDGMSRAALPSHH
jgi:AcrR family transcriptional regulator